jgi:hypothetical protein
MKDKEVLSDSNIFSPHHVDSVFSQPVKIPELNCFSLLFSTIDYGPISHKPESAVVSLLGLRVRIPQVHRYLSLVSVMC